jgi:hypothetical protein
MLLIGQPIINPPNPMLQFPDPITLIPINNGIVSAFDDLFRLTNLAYQFLSPIFEFRPFVTIVGTTFVFHEFGERMRRILYTDIANPCLLEF